MQDHAMGGMPLAGFGSILHQEAAVGALRSALSTGRLAHGLLFAGPGGVGKGTTAQALARAFLCEAPTGCDGRAGPVDGCGRCPSCKMMDAAEGVTHPDFHVVFRQLGRRIKKDTVARDMSVDVIRDYVVKPAGLTTQMGRGKVFVLEEADTMNPAAQNALLKTLEEPPGRTLIVLLAESPGILLSTIRSRCQPVYFGPLPIPAVAEELVRRGIDPGVAAEAAGLTGGSLGEALRLIDDDLVGVLKELEKRLVATLSRQGNGDLAKYMKTTGDKLAAQAHKRDPEGSEDFAKRESLALLTRLGENVLRRFLRSARTVRGTEKLCGGIEALARARVQFDANVSLPVALQNLVAELER